MMTTTAAHTSNHTQIELFGSFVVMFTNDAIGGWRRSVRMSHSDAIKASESAAARWLRVAVAPLTAALAEDPAYSFD